MSTLSSALSLALSGLSVTASQSALAARNVNNAAVEGYTRKTAELHVLPGGAPAVAGYSRSTDKALADKLLSATSTALEKEGLAAALSRLGALSGDPAQGGSIASALGKLQQSLRVAAASPADTALAAAALEAGRTVAARLNAASREVESVRADADSEMAQSVERINLLLQQFKSSNDTVVRGLGTPEELAETLDQRDNTLRLLSEEIGIRTVTRPNNDVLIFATGGAVLFEGSPRSVSFMPAQPLDAASPGAAVLIDGVPVTGASVSMAISGGRLAAAAQVRSQLGPRVQMQLDEIASGLITAFGEFGPPGSALPPAAGLFIDPGSGLPASLSAPRGIAGRLAVSALADPDQGGRLSLLRDGGFGGPSYVYNGAGVSGFQARLSELADSLDRTTSFASGSGLAASATLKELSAQSAAWIEAQRKTAATAADAATALRVRASDSLQKISGVSIDEEMASLLDLEKSYQAASKIISIVDAMLASLLDAVR